MISLASLTEVTFYLSNNLESSMKLLCWLKIKSHNRKRFLIFNARALLYRGGSFLI